MWLVKCASSIKWPWRKNRGVNTFSLIFAILRWSCFFSFQLCETRPASHSFYADLALNASVLFQLIFGESPCGPFSKSSSKKLFSDRMCITASLLKMQTVLMQKPHNEILQITFREIKAKKWVIMPLSAFCWTYCKYFPADLFCLREALSPASAHASCYKLICILDTFTPTELPLECFLSIFAPVRQQRELAPSSVC